MTAKPRCLIIDGQPTVRLGVRGLLADSYEVEEANDGNVALELITSLGDFDVAIVELSGSGHGNGNGETLVGMAAIRALRKELPGLGIVAHGPRPEKHAASAAISAGATAFVAKSSPPDSLTEAVTSAADSQKFIDPIAVKSKRAVLTKRQREILQHYADGDRTAAVAKRLGLSTETVRTHTKAALQRLGARDRAHAVAIGIRNSLIE
jgi:DNA-binding NarL/FixJ family response regulator